MELKDTASITMRSVAVMPDCCQESWLVLLMFVAHMKTGMKSTVTIDKIMRVANIGERALLFTIFKLAFLMVNPL